MKFDLKLHKYLLMIILFFSCANHKENNLSLSPLFSDGMVLQKDTVVPIWGTTNPKKKVEIKTSWGDQGAVKADNSGKWIIEISTIDDFGPHTITVHSGYDTIKVNDVLLGEVWLAAGQSNMEMDFEYCCNTTDNSYEEISSANFPNLRMFSVKKHLSYKPTYRLDGSWEKAVGSNISSFSAVGYFFAKSLHQELNTPIGIIHASWGGSRLESWTSHDVLNELSAYENEFKEINEHQKRNVKARDWFSRYPEVRIPSGDFDMFLGEYLREKAPEIDYLGYFLNDWRVLDAVGINLINDVEEKVKWEALPYTNKLDKSLGIDNFKGAVLFRNYFQNDDFDDEIFIRLGPGEDMPWGSWEYDIYVNSRKIGSSLMTIKKDDYQFLKTSKEFKIDNEILNLGKNSIIVRVLGHARLGDMSLISRMKGALAFGEKWEYSLLGEEFFQIDDYRYPYVSLFSYEGQNIDLSKVPKKTIMNHQTIGTLFNGMLNPIIPYGIRGIIWYQGETNIENGGPEFDNYATLMPLMIEDLRNRWGMYFPFYYAQIAPYFNYNGMSPYFRDIQRKLLNVQGTGMVITLDIGENYDIHPSNKHDVGDRFARLALSKLYGRGIISSGPIVKSAKLINGKVKVEFDYVASGLVLKNNNRTEFEVAAGDKDFHPASALNKNTYLNISYEMEGVPKYLRYAFSDTSKAILFNSEGLPASSFEIKIN